MFTSNPLLMPLFVFGDHSDRVAQGLRPRNFLRQPLAHQDLSKNEAFSAGGILIEIANTTGDANLNARQKLFALMISLENRMGLRPNLHAEAGELWSDPLEDNAPNAIDNLSIPSGYTYLLQFIAHDMVDTVRSMSLAKNQSGEPVAAPAFRNARHRPLMLDTLYGDGPDENPHAFATTNSDKLLPRTLLRTGPRALGGLPLPEPHQFCPFRDIARSRPPGGEDDVLSEAHVADSRNDSHALISQLTVVFHLLHNEIMKEIPMPDGATIPTDMSAENAYRRFICARDATTLIYRNIVERDVLFRILDRDVYDAYLNSEKPPLDDDGEVPAEFFAGAFRFGHAMVRETYVTNHGEAEALQFSRALEISSRRTQKQLPRTWAIDWSLFFGSPAAGARFNFSRRIGPSLTGSLMEGSKTQDVAIHGMSFSDRGLPSRDLLTSSYSGLWSVPALFKEINRGLGRNPDGLRLPDFSIWEEPLRRWLKGNGTSVLTAEQIELLVKDPPLPFFVLFEAAHQLDEQGLPITAPYDEPPHQFIGKGGSRLGRFGSILVGDPIFRALRSKPFGVVRAGATLREQIADVCQALLNQRDALDSITLRNGVERKLDTMPELLAFLADREGNFA
jgi:hypothetical protein